MHRGPIDKLIVAAVLLLALLSLAAALNPLLGSPPPPPSSPLPAHDTAYTTTMYQQARQDRLSQRWRLEASEEAAQARQAQAQAEIRGAVEALAAIRYEQAQQAAAARRAAAAAQQAAASTAPAVPAAAGMFSYTALEQLWLQAGGPAQAEAQAAQIAECESGGNPDAWNPSGASGLWQILGQVADFGQSLFSPWVNAVNAVTKYRNAGDSFAPWVCQ